MNIRNCRGGVKERADLQRNGPGFRPWAKNIVAFSNSMPYLPLCDKSGYETDRMSDVNVAVCRLPSAMRYLQRGVP